jgi:hypothetical protein
LSKSVIGLTGQKGAGKDEVAKILVDAGYVRVAFADPLKAIATVIGWDGSKEELPPCSHCGMLQGRQLLQVLGTEGVRANIGRETWLDVARREIQRHKNVVVSDVRFFNEAGLIHMLGGEVWRVVRPGYSGDSHASEAEQNLIVEDATITNDGSLADLLFTVEVAARFGVGHGTQVLGPAIWS